MKTPIVDFVRAYADSDPVRMHMPGHKGQDYPLDITEIRGADELYRARGIIRESEENAAALFGSARTFYSCEGSSLCIRAMLQIASLYVRENGKKPVVLAGRNAHRVFVYACALLDLDVKWMFGQSGEGLLSCTIDEDELEKRLIKEKASIVYITSPDYAGHMSGIAELARVCHRHGALLLVDNAHGAYLKFLPGEMHPMDAGADMCCDSAHKTLPVLTGGAYLHIGKEAPVQLANEAEDAFALFASTSPSYLIMQSLDRANAVLESREFADGLKTAVRRCEQLRASLQKSGYGFEGDEPMKLCVLTGPHGYTGTETGEYLRAEGIECEYIDPARIIMMPSAATREQDIERVERVLCTLPAKAALVTVPPEQPRAVKVCSLREAMLAPRCVRSVRECVGETLADACVSCPPCVPILMPGEKVTDEAVRCFEYYHIDRLSIIR